VIIIPSIVAQRWREAVANPTIPRWYSLGWLCANMADLIEQHNPKSKLVWTLNRMAQDAVKHELRLMPRIKQ
jgi:hypothetical protein